MNAEKRMNLQFSKTLEYDINALITIYPFFAGIMNKSQIVLNNKMRTHAALIVNSKGFVLFLNPRKMMTSTRKERLFVYLHEISHYIYDHYLLVIGSVKARKLDMGVVNLCLDADLNYNLDKEPELQTPFWVIMPEYFNLPNGLHWEEYYDIVIRKGNKIKITPRHEELMDQQKNDQPQEFNKDLFRDDHTSFSDGDGDNGDGGDSQSTSLAPDFEDLHEMWKENEKLDNDTKKQIVKNSIKDAVDRAAGKVPGFLQTQIQTILKPKINWIGPLRNVFQRSIKSSSVYSWLYQSRIDPDGLLMGKKQDQKTNVILLADTSGSMRDEELERIYAEADAIRKTNEAEITVIEFDSAIQNVYKFDRNVKPTFKGRGGTDFKMVFEFIENNGDPSKWAKIPRNPDLVICMTDGGDVAPDRPKFQVLFLITEHGRKPVDKNREVPTWASFIQVS